MIAFIIYTIIVMFFTSVLTADHFYRLGYTTAKDKFQSSEDKKTIEDAKDLINKLNGDI